MSFNFSQQTCLETGNSFGIPVGPSGFCLTWVVAGPRPTTRSTGLTTGRGNPPAGPPDPDRPDRPGHPPGGLQEGSRRRSGGTSKKPPQTPSNSSIPEGPPEGEFRAVWTGFGRSPRTLSGTLENRRFSRVPARPPSNLYIKDRLSEN